MKIIDLTQTIEAGMKVYDGDPEVKYRADSPLGQRRVATEAV
jgi:kynurenine formamidase